MPTGQLNRIARTLFAVLLSLALALMALPATALAATAPTTQKKLVRVGFFALDGYHMEDATGARSGYGYDVLQDMARYNDWEFSYVGYAASWSQAQEMLANGEIDILTSAQKTASREEQFGFSDLSIGTSSTILTVKSGDSRYVAGDYGTYEGMRVGMVANNSRNDSFAQFAADNGFSFTPVMFSSTSQMTKALQDGRQIDAIVTSNLRSVENEWVLNTFDASPFYVMTQKGDATLLSEVNYALSQMDIAQPDWRTNLQSKYYTPSNGDSIAFSSVERTYLARLEQDDTVFTVAINPDGNPYTSFDGQDAVGIVPQIFAEIAARTGIKYQVLYTPTRADYDAAINNGQPDLIIDSTYDYYQAESRGYQLTDSYLSTTISAVTLNDAKGTATRIAIPSGSNSKAAAAKAIPNDSVVLEFSTIDDCLDALRKHNVDAAYLYTYRAQSIIENDERNEFDMALLPSTSTDFKVAVSSRIDHRLLSIVNKGADSVSGDYAQKVVLAATDQDNRTSTLLGFVYDQPLAAMAILAVLAVLIGIAVIAVLRARRADADAQHQAQLERFIGYVCTANDLVMEVNMQDDTCVRYQYEEGRVIQTDGPYGMLDRQNPDNRIHPDDFKRLTADLTLAGAEQMIAEGGERYFECRTREDGGEYRWYAFTLQAVPVDKFHPCNFILFKRDINESKAHEERSRKALADALETARKASAAKGTFLSRMSHEIRTPLNAVIGYMAIAKLSEDNPQKVGHCIENSELAAKHLLSIINDVLDISSIESGRMKMAHADFDLRSQLATVSTIFYNQAKEKGITFNVVLHGITEEWVVGDQLRVNQVLMNLLSNAVKFTPAEGAVSLTVSQTRLESDQVFFTFEVRDTGIGMSEEYKTRLFKPFEQESATTAQKYGGTGLGLSITNNLVNMMGGSIEVESHQGQGTNFVVSLAFARSDENKLAHEERHDFSDVRALIVDDAESDCDYIKALLKRCGVKSDIVHDGPKAVKQINRRKGTDYSYDLCIMDWNMPGMDGIETARIIHDECDVNLPIIIATAYDISEIEDEARAAGVDRVVAKPLFQSTLFDLLVSEFGKYQPLQGGAVPQVDLSGYRILLAEDNAMNREIAEDILRRSGLVVESAVDGQEAVDMFLAAKPSHYQAILMDVQMPRLDGYQATRTIRASQHAQGKDIPIIAMTANAFEEDVAAALASGMNDHVAKPVDYGKLYKSLVKFIKQDSE